MHHFHVDNLRGDEGVVYDIIIGSDLILQLGMEADFGHQILEWYKTVLHMKDTGNILGQPDSTKP